MIDDDETFKFRMLKISDDYISSVLDIPTYIDDSTRERKLATAESTVQLDMKPESERIISQKDDDVPLGLKRIESLRKEFLLLPEGPRFLCIQYLTAKIDLKMLNRTETYFNSNHLLREFCSNVEGKLFNLICLLPLVGEVRKGCK